MMLAAGVPPALAALSLALNTNLFGAITHYASGQGAVYYGAGESTVARPPCSGRPGISAPWDRYPFVSTGWRRVQQPIDLCRAVQAVHLVCIGAWLNSSPAPLAGFLDLQQVFKMGAVLSIVNLAVWITVGSASWKLLGLY